MAGCRGRRRPLTATPVAPRPSGGSRGLLADSTPARPPSRRRRRWSRSSPRPARARPVCSPAASPIASPPASADARHTLALTFTREAAGELRRRLRRLGPARPRRGRHVPLRRARPAAAALGRPRPAHRRPSSATGERLLAEVAGGVRVADARRRGRLGRGPGRRAPTATSPRPRRAGRRGAMPPDAHRRRRSPPTRRSSAAAASSTSTTCCVLAPRAGARPGVRADAVRWRFRHVLVDEAQDLNPRAAPAARASSSAGATTSTSSATRPRRSTGSTAPTPTLLADVERHAARRRGHPPADQPPLHAADRRRRHGTSCGPAASAATPCRRAATAPAVRDRRRRRRGPRGGARRARSCAPLDPGAVRAGDGRRARPHQRPARPAAPRRSTSAGVPVCAASCRPGARWPRSYGPVTALPSAVAAARLGPRRARRPRRRTRATPIAARPPSAGSPRPCSTSSATSRSATARAAGVDRRRRNPFADADGVAGVELLTFHAAKGREWHTVVVTGVETGLVPHRSATTADARAEEARLLHVAVTRASDRLVHHLGGPPGRLPPAGQPADRRHRRRPAPRPSPPPAAALRGAPRRPRAPLDRRWLAVAWRERRAAGDLLLPTESAPTPTWRRSPRARRRRRPSSSRSTAFGPLTAAASSGGIRAALDDPVADVTR